jgi:Kelch motif
MRAAVHSVCVIAALLSVISLPSPATGVAAGPRDQAEDSWRPLPGGSRYRHTAVWTGSEMVVWGGHRSGPPPPFELDDGARYDPSTDRWTPVSRVGAPSPRGGHAAVWTGEEMFVWGGYTPNGWCCLRFDGGRYNPVQNIWIPVPATDLLPPRYSVTAVWTGDEVLLWGGTVPNGAGVPFESGAAYRPGPRS